MQKNKGRLASIQAMIPEHTTRLIDVGCDHGLLSRAFLAENPRAEALLIDKREGPLSAAKENLAAEILQGRARLRLSDGLASWDPRPGDTVAAAGMGALEIAEILQRFSRREVSDDPSAYPFVFQPMQDFPLLRRALAALGLQQEKQSLAEARGKVYSIDLYSVPLRTLKQLQKARRTDAAEDWLGEAFCRADPAFMTANPPALRSVYFRRQMQSARNELNGLKGAEARARRRMLEEAFERKRIYET